LRRACALTASALTVVLLAPPAAAGTPWLIPPVDGVIEARFQAPEVTWGPGHRGIDLAATPGTAIRAAGAGTVTFAGLVAGIGAVTIDHGNGIETTYSIADDISVSAGQEVAQGTWIGRVSAAHPGRSSGLHFAVKVEGVYVDPEDHLAPVNVSRAIHLAPLTWEPPPELAYFDVPDGGPDDDCARAPALEHSTTPPNDNVAVAVAGIGSRTAGGVAAVMYERGPQELGYPASRVYRFSYKGSGGPGLHEPYASSDTWGDIRGAAVKLGRLLLEVHRLHPERGIDLIAHSQGGIVARTYLELVATGAQPGAPPIEHLVTFASPHEGAPWANAGAQLETSLVGRALVSAISAWARNGGPIPDPRSPAVAQLRPSSELMASLGRQDLVYGTRALTLAIPNDVIVPASRALMTEESHHVVPPEGINGHESIVSSAEARAVAHAFLRDAPEACGTRWDDLGVAAGWLIGKAEEKLPGLLADHLPGP